MASQTGRSVRARGTPQRISGGWITVRAKSMGYEKTIVCLANSRKPPSGRCVAGREIEGGRFDAWIRPVSERTTREVSLEERRYEYGRDPQVLDIITIRFARPEPELYQRENHVIHPDYYWIRSGTVSWSDLQRAVEDPYGPLWLNGDSSSHGENDRVAETDAAGLERSLYLIRPERLRLLVAREGAGIGRTKRKVRARFRLCGHTYCLAVTDPPIELDYLAQQNGEYPVPEALLCVSLGELFHGYAYKLAAAVITPDRAETAP